MRWYEGWLPWLERGQAHWCGQFWIIHAPVRLSKAMGRGTSGLWLYRWTERGHDTIRKAREWRKKQKANR